MSATEMHLRRATAMLDQLADAYPPQENEAHAVLALFRALVVETKAAAKAAEDEDVHQDLVAKLVDGVMQMACAGLAAQEIERIRQAP